MRSGNLVVGVCTTVHVLHLCMNECALVYCALLARMGEGRVLKM